MNFENLLQPVRGRARRAGLRALIAGLAMVWASAAIIDQAAAQGAGETSPITMEDLFPLRYYLENEQYDRVEAEIRRLRSIDPEWQVPADLLTRTLGPDEAPVWNALAGQDISAAEDALARLRQEFPTYTPSAELTTELRRASGQARLRTALTARDWRGAIAAAEAAPDIVTCGRVDNVWGLAEAFARVGEISNATAVWGQAIDLCGRYDIVAATIEKADAFVSRDGLDGLVNRAIAAMGREDDFNALAERLIAGREAGVGGPEADTDTDGASAAASSPQPTPPSRTSAPATPAASSSGAVTGGPVSLTSAPSGGGGTPGVDIAIASEAYERQDYARCLAATRNARTASPLLVRGWCLYEMNRPTEAQLAFAEAQTLTAIPQERIDSQFGEILSMLRRQLVDEAESRMQSASLTPEFENDISAEILAQKAILAYEAGQYQRAVVLVDARRAMAPDRRDLSVIEGYSLYNLDQLTDADRVFRRLDRELSTPESREGLRIVRSRRE